MKKLLTSLTILALISPIGPTVANAQDSESRTGNTTASVTITGVQEIRNIEVKGHFKFNPIDINFGKDFLPTTVAVESETAELTVTDTYYETEGYTVNAKLIEGLSGNSFPQDTTLTLKKAEETATPNVEAAYGHGTPPTPEMGDIKLTLGGEAESVLTAVRTIETPLAGAGQWTISYEAIGLEIPYKDNILKPGTELTGVIKWSLGNATQ